MLLTAPQLASVVTVANSADAAMPNRVSFPSMFPPDWEVVGARSMPILARFGLPACSAGYAIKAPTRDITDMAEKRAQPCRVSFTMWPKVYVSPAPRMKINRIWTRFANGVGPSNGCDELALKNPPPLV